MFPCSFRLVCGQFLGAREYIGEYAQAVREVHGYSTGGACQKRSTQEFFACCTRNHARYPSRRRTRKLHGNYTPGTRQVPDGYPPCTRRVPGKRFTKKGAKLHETATSPHPPGISQSHAVSTAWSERVQPITRRNQRVITPCVRRV